MATLHLRNTVRDFDEWKVVFDKFQRFRADRGARSYRVSRSLDDPHEVTIDVDFETVDQARAFKTALAEVRTTPQSRAQLVSFHEPELLEVVEERQLAPSDQ